MRNAGHKILAGLVAMIVLCATVSSAFATPAIAAGTASVRAGPGKIYGQVDLLVRGERLYVTECKFGWCHVERAGPQGWVSERHMFRAGNRGHIPGEHVDFYVEVEPWDTRIYLKTRTPPPHPYESRACFYEHPNFDGASFCASSGADNKVLMGFWNDSISSVRLTGGATATVCSKWQFGGDCHTITASERFLGRYFDNNTSSYWID